MLFKITDKPFFVDNPEAKAIPSFLKAGDSAMKYIALYYAYNSPFRHVSVEEKRDRILSICDIKKTPTGRKGKLEKALISMTEKDLRAAVKDFKDMQFDFDRDTHEAYVANLNSCKELLRKSDRSPKEVDQALKISKEFNDMVEREKELRAILDIRGEEEFKIDSEDEDYLTEDSLLEKFQE